MVRTNQGGSILSFVVLGGVMALLLVGGAYVFRHNLAPAQKAPQVAVSDKDRSDNSTGQGSTSDQAAPVQNKDQPENTKKPDQSTASGSANSSADNKQTPAAPAPAGDSHASGGLPTTGPSDVVLGGIMLSGLVAVSIVYVQSRRLQASL